MEDVNGQTEKQTNEKNHRTNATEMSNDVQKRKINELDKFKRRLIRAIARLLYTENKAEADIWEDLKTETGCDCELLWSRMRALTIKKLVRLFTAEDKIENITKIAQLSVTDWLLFDLVLVHEKVDVIGQENKEEPAFLRDLFDLVEEYNIECDLGETLITKWFDATAKYNNTGKRQCSPMLLQKRWYQLKERSRSNFYNFWFQYRGDSKKLEKANEFKPSDLQLDIVKRYKDIVTKPFLNWEELIKEGRVALPEDFERLRLGRNEITITENEPDLEVIEPQVETIDLEETNSSNDSVFRDNKEGFNDFNIDIVKIESLAEQDDDVSVLESVHIPLEKSRSVDINNSDETMCDLEIIESDSEQIMPKIASVTSTACLESGKDSEEFEKLPPKEIIDIQHSKTRAKSLSTVNIILEQIVKNVVERKINTKFDEKIATTSKDLHIEKSNRNIIDLDKDGTKKPDIKKNTGEKYDLNIDIGFDDFSTNLNFIDDGIEFVDDGIEYMDEEYSAKSELKTEITEATNEKEPKIDLKLLLTPVVFTKKLDDMDVFRFIEYNTVKDDRVLQNAARESKPEDKKSINMKKMLQENNHVDSSSIKAESGDVISDDEIANSGDGTPGDDIAKSSDVIHNDIAISSWLFRKPKLNNYNPIQLCKNPDFNTRLKRLSAAFYTSQRNRLLLKKCKPLTVDLHKTFESKLINNTLYLKRSKNNSDNEIANCKTDLPDKIEPSNDNGMASDKKMTTEPISEVHTERNKVINLPDKEQIRRVNQGLLVAEVSPIQVSNPVNQEKNKQHNVVIEPVVHEMDSTDKEIIETPANVSQFSLQAEKIITVSENDNSKLTEIINVDVEQSETLSSKYNVIDSAKNYKGYNKNSFLKQPVPKPKPKTYSKKYMELSWLPKPQTVRTDVIDCLLAADTVERILRLCKNDYISPDPKLLKAKRKKKTAKNKNVTENQAAVKKRNTVQDKINEKERPKPKKNKCRISITTQTTNVKNVCCWSRQKIENFYKIHPGKHFCAHNKCVCCCKADLEAKVLAIKEQEQRKRCELIILSDDESITITAAKKHFVSKVTIGTNTDYDKDFEDQFAANLNLLKDNANQVYTPVISLPLDNLPQALNNESGCQTLTPNTITKTPPATLDNKTTETTTEKNRPKVPICLGKNKILLCSFKTTTDAVSAQKIKKCSQNSQTEQILPEGCQLVLLPNRELALSIDPGVELDANQLSKLPSLIASVQKQLNVIPISEKILEPYNSTLNEETVIHLSDDENSSIKDNFNINDFSKSKTSIESSNANKVTNVSAIANEEIQISTILSNPKESCNISKPVIANNSTVTDIEDVNKEPSTNEIISKYSGEVDTTNNIEDASGGNKKTILSDLMEMSGISTDDINVTNNDVNAAVNDGSAARNNDSVSIIHQVFSHSDSSTSDLQREYANITRKIGINPIMNNLVVRAALLRCPELNIVSSFPELKYAYENSAQFYRMNIVNGIIVPINVCIKKDFGKKEKKGISKVPKSVIDLTKDNEIATCSTNIQPIQQKVTNESFEETQNIQSNKDKNAIKPIKMFKAIHPSILRYSGRSLLVRPLKNSTVAQNNITGVTKHKRKQGHCVKDLDLKADNKLRTKSKIDSEAESDEEPLAKKAKRLKNNLERNAKNDSSLIGNDINSKESATEDLKFKMPSQLEPIVFDDSHGLSSDEDCILGV